MSHQPTKAATGKSKFLTLQSLSFPVILGVLTGLAVAAVPASWIVFLAVVGALTIFGGELLQATFPTDKKALWWSTRILVLVFNTVVVILSVLFTTGMAG
jgi:hypothetical protein